MTDITLYEHSDIQFSTWRLARSMSSEQFTAFLDDYLNLGGKQFAEGKRVGTSLRTTHRTLQRCLVAFCLGIIAGISDQDLERTDARNRQAIATAQKITEMVDKGELSVGAYL